MTLSKLFIRHMWMWMLAPLAVSSAVATQITSGNGEVAALLHLDANTALAGTINGGLYRSVDQGASWNRVTSLPRCSVKALAKASASQVFAATECGLQKSVDSGVTWTLVSAQPSSALAVTATASATVLLGVPGVGILRSVDGGATFVDASAGLDSTDIRAIAIDPSNSLVVYAALFNPDWYPTNPAAPLALGGVFRSTDGGVTWSNFNQPAAGTALASRWVTGVAVNSAGTVFASTLPPVTPSNGTVQRYSTGLGGWAGPSTVSPSEAGIYGAETVTVDPNGADVWVGSNNLGPYVWVQGSNQLRRQMDGAFAADGVVLNKVNAISAFTGSSTLVGVAGLGVYRSGTINPGTGIRGYSPWTAPTVDVQADRALSFVRNPVSNESFIGLAGGGVVKAPAASTNYILFNAGFNHAAGVSNVFATPSVQYLAATTAGDVFIASTGRGVLRSTAGSAAWSGLTSSSWWATGLAASPSANEVYAAEFFLQASPGLYRVPSVGGPVFVQGAWQSGAGLSNVAASPSGNARIYALAADSAGVGSGTNAAGYVVPTAGGSSTPMVPVHAGFQRLGFYAATDSGSTVVAASLKGLFRSVDGGANFSRLAATGLPASGVVGLTTQAGVFFGVTRRGELICSTDLGSTWQTKLSTNTRAVGLTRDGSSVVVLTDGAGIFVETAVCP